MSADGAVSFVTSARRGMPQGSPESPIVYAALIEDLVVQTEAEIIVAQRAAGVKLDLDETTPEQVMAVSNDIHNSTHVPFLNFADDTYALGHTLQATSYAVGLLAKNFAAAQQILHPGKCEVLEPEGAAAEVTIMDDGALRAYQEAQPCAHRGHVLKQVSSILVLGSHISADPAQEQGLSHRISAAWHVWHKVRPQLGQKRVPQRVRCKLLQATAGASIMWGLESVVLPGPARRRLDGVQRKMLAPVANLARRPTENLQQYHRRRERVVTSLVRRFFPCRWGQAQRYKFFTLAGQTARLSSAHVVPSAFFWRDMHWWTEYRASFRF